MPNRAIVQAKRIMDIRSGPGSIALPPQFTELHVSFGRKINMGHMGPRKFVQQNLPRIQFHNPALAIHVTRVYDEADPKNVHVEAILKVVKSGQEASQVQGIDVRGMHSDDILKKLVEVTGATEAGPSTETVQTAAP